MAKKRTPSPKIKESDTSIPTLTPNPIPKESEKETTLHPLLIAQFRVDTRFSLLRAGRSREEINTATDAIDTGYVTLVASNMPNGSDVLNGIQAVGATGGGLAALLAAIAAFLATPAGQQLEAALVAALIKLLGG